MCGRAAFFVTRRLGWRAIPQRLRRGWARKGKLICFDRDPQAMELAKVRLEEVEGRARSGDAGGGVVAQGVL